MVLYYFHIVPTSPLVFRHAQALAAIKPYAHWLAQFYSESTQFPEQRQKFTDLVTTLLDAVVGLFDEQVSTQLVI